MRRVLIANRGEIALRILRTCHALGIETVAAFSKVDKNQRHLDLATDAVCISETSYLDPGAFIGAALSRDCDAIHPGYGLLSENSDFAEQVTGRGLTFIGPSADVMRTMGDKVAARDKAKSLGLDVIEGKTVENVDDALKWAEHEGFPVIVKAAHGGGGRGMRLVKNAADLQPMIRAAQSESGASFGSELVYLEKFLGDARHVEVQVLGDGDGGAIHLGTRDCTVQRNYQKLIEEAPAPFIEAAALEQVAMDCAAAAAALGYAGAGTFEFLYSGGRFFFIEMNTRLQVEHPVTEMITGLDLVAAQIRIARGDGLPCAQADVALTGHAIECRINAESVTQAGDLRPSPGLVEQVTFPGGTGIRVDSHLYAGYRIPHQYDSMVGKIIAHGQSRAEARARLIQALAETRVSGVETNVDRLRRMIAGDEFDQGALSRVAEKVATR